MHSKRAPLNSEELYDLPHCAVLQSWRNSNYIFTRRSRLAHIFYFSHFSVSIKLKKLYYLFPFYRKNLQLSVLSHPIDRDVLDTQLERLTPQSEKRREEGYLRQFLSFFSKNDKSHKIFFQFWNKTKHCRRTCYDILLAYVDVRKREMFL